MTTITVFDFGKIESKIKDVEKIIQDYDIDSQQYIIQKLLQRINTRLRQQQQQDDMANIPGMALGSKIIGKFGKGLLGKE